MSAKSNEWWPTIAAASEFLHSTVRLEESFRAVRAGRVGTVTEVVPLKLTDKQMSLSKNSRRKSKAFGLRIVFDSRDRPSHAVSRALMSRAEFAAHIRVIRKS